MSIITRGFGPRGGRRVVVPFERTRVTIRVIERAKKIWVNLKRPR